MNDEQPDDPTPSNPKTRAASIFVLELARAMHEYGTPAHRLESALSAVAGHLGLEAEFFSTPTSIMVGFGDLLDQHVHLLRVEPSSPNLGNLARLSDIIRDVVEMRVTPELALDRVRALKAHPPAWPTWLVRVAFVLSSAAVACFLHVRIGDVIIASVLGLLCGEIVRRAQRSDTLRPVTEPLAAFAITTLAFACDAVAHTNSGYATSLAGLVILLPGLMFTVALTELSTRHLSSGTARLAGAMVIFLGLGFGIALGAKLGTVVGHELRVLQGNDILQWLPRDALPRWTEWTALLIAPLSFCVLLNAHRRDTGWIVLMCVAAYVTSRYAGASMGEELGAFLGAFVVGAGSNLTARYFKRNAMVTQVPGLLILVPGSIGFRSVTSLLGQEVELGIATAFRVAIVGISLAAGILAGNVATRTVIRRRKLAASI